MYRAEQILSKFATPDILTRREFVSGGQKGCLLFSSDLSNGAAIGNMIHALEREEDKIPDADALIRRIIYVSSAAAETDVDAVVTRILDGECAVIIEGLAEMVMADTRQWDKRGVSEPTTEAVVRGPREGFTEDLKTNLSLIERKLKTPQLALQRLKIGRNAGVNVGLVYLDNVINPKVVEEIKRRLKAIDIDAIFDSYNLEPFLEYRPYSMFKQVGYTERPDIAASKICEGRAAVVVDGSPIVLTLPFLLIEDFRSPEDYYQRFSYTTFLRFLRLFALLMAVMLPGLYVCILRFNFDLVPLKFLVTIMNAMKGTPLPPLAEMLLVIGLFEVVREACTRMPRLVSVAMGIVAAIVLGETVVRAGIISSPSILIIALSSIAMFTAPNHIGPMTLLRIIFTVLGGLLGLYGLVLGAVSLFHYLSDLDSYGTPYLAPLAPLVYADYGDSFIKRPIIEMKKRPKSIKNINPTRQN
ncbi:MAG: spore germination protein [Firmicutes bacterium]|nr:spore germination protein [Bacillota bacterium]